jgi:hypothetical protein
MLVECMLWFLYDADLWHVPGLFDGNKILVGDLGEDCGETRKVESGNQTNRTKADCDQTVENA